MKIGFIGIMGFITFLLISSMIDLENYKKEVQKKEEVKIALTKKDSL